MAFDFKKEYKEFYNPKNKAEIVTVPAANFIAVRGQGNPNEEAGQYKAAVAVQYAVAYTIKMSRMGDHKMPGYFDFVVPPLEGLWWQDEIDGADYSHKENFSWISLIRLPDFVTKEEFYWAVKAASEKKKIDCSRAELFSYDEGLCVQIMHNGPFDDEPFTISLLDKYIEENGFMNDFTGGRLHHEIYLSNPRKVSPEKLKTIVRHPIKKIEEKFHEKTDCLLRVGL